MCLGRHGKRGCTCPRANPNPSSSRRGWCSRRCRAPRPSARSPPSTASTPTWSGTGRRRPSPTCRASSPPRRTGGRAGGSSRGTGRRSMTCIARSASSPPSAIIFNAACLSATSSKSRTCLVDPGNAEVPVARQCQLLGIPRSSHCYRPRRRRHVAGLMKKMSVRPVCPKPSPSKPAKRTSSHMLQSMDGRAAESTT